MHSDKICKQVEHTVNLWISAVALIKFSAKLGPKIGTFSTENSFSKKNTEENDNHFPNLICKDQEEDFKLHSTLLGRCQKIFSQTCGAYSRIYGNHCSNLTLVGCTFIQCRFICMSETIITQFFGLSM